jgi:hypothetical protein
MSAVKTCDNDRTRLAMQQLQAIIRTNVGLGDDAEPQQCERFTQDFGSAGGSVLAEPQVCVEGPRHMTTTLEFASLALLATVWVSVLLACA